jgi:hypothetical protein
MCDESRDRLKVENTSGVFTHQQLDDSMESRREHELTAFEAHPRDSFLAGKFVVHALGECGRCS